MRTLYAYIRSHFAEGFKPWYYLTVLGFIGICIFNNYAAAPEGYRSWESWIILTFYGKNTFLCVVAYFLFYGLPYFSIAMITALFYRDAQFFKLRDLGKGHFYIDTDQFTGQFRSAQIAGRPLFQCLRSILLHQNTRTPQPLPDDRHSGVDILVVARS